MSRVGKSPITLPSGVAVTASASSVEVKGPKGSLSQAVVSMVAVSVDDNVVTVSRSNESKPARANHGLMRALVNNMVVGVSEGFKKELTVIGVGYRADVKGKNLVMQLGYSHPIEYLIPAGIGIQVDKSNKITVSGIDKQQVGQVSAEIRAFRKPDHYKGKGVRYVDEYVRIKQGKSS
jgi:large subunit ribosomal protein L6